MRSSVTADRPDLDARAESGPPLLALLVFLPLVFASRVWWYLPDADSATYIMEAQRLLDGARFHVDILETNPPLIVLLTMPGVLIGYGFGLAPWTAHVAWLCCLVVLSFVAAFPYLAWLLRDWPRPGLAATALYLATVTVIPGEDFPQRENLTMLLCLPALLSFAAREGGRAEISHKRSVLVFAMASVGFLMKPFFLLVPAVLLVARALQHRQWRRLVSFEALLLTVAVLLYAGVVLLAFPDWLTTAALATQLYSGFNLSWPSTLWHFKFQTVVLVASFALLGLAPMHRASRMAVLSLLLAAASFLLLAILQRKGWGYHGLPSRTLRFLALALMGFAYAKQVPRGGAARGGLAVLACLGAYYAFTVLRYHVLEGRYLQQTFLTLPFPRAVNELAEGRPWFALSTSVSPSFPTNLLVNEAWRSRSVHQWMMPGIVRLLDGDAEARARGEAMRRVATGFIASDLEQHRPVLVAVSVGKHQGITVPFEFLPFLSQEQEFRRAWAPYHLVRIADGWEFYRRAE